MSVCTCPCRCPAQRKPAAAAPPPPPAPPPPRNSKQSVEHSPSPPEESVLQLQGHSLWSDMNWFTLAFRDAEDEEAYQQEWARTYFPTMRLMVHHSLFSHVIILLGMWTWGASLGRMLAQVLYILITGGISVACRAWFEQPSKWHGLLALAQFGALVGDALPLAVDPTPPVAAGSPFGTLRLYPVLTIIGCVLAGSSACASAVVCVSFSLCFVAAYVSGLFPWTVLSGPDWLFSTMYVFWSTSVGYFHETRIRQAWVLARRLRKAAEAADAGLRAKSLFLSNCNHELRTPLHGIIGMTELLVETDLSDEQRDFLATVRHCTETLHAMVCDILDLEKAAAGQLEIERRPFALRGPLESATDVLYLQALSKDVDLACSLEAGLADARVVGDEIRVQQVVVNLASNAIKFSAPAPQGSDPEGEGDTSRRGANKQRRGQVMVRAERGEGPDGAQAVRISVRDNGIGIPVERLGDLFRPFSQLEVGHTRKYGGTGLGLALVKSFVEQMGGHVAVKSTPGEGSTFTVVLPLPPSDEEEQETLKVEEEVVPPGAAEVRLREWRASTREALEGALAAEGWELREGAPLLFTDCPEEAAAARLAAPRRRIVELLPPGAKAGPEAAGRQRLLLPVKSDALRAVLRAGPAAPSGRRSESPAPRPRISSTGSLDGAPLRLQETRVLIAEDNEVNARLLSRMLGRLGFPHDTVPDGEAAVEACRSGRYGLLITDIQMPRKSGWEACEEVRALRASGAIAKPIIVVGCSANATAEDRERSRQVGMIEHLSKPCRLEQLRELLKRIGLLEEEGGAPAAGGESSRALPTPADLPPLAIGCAPGTSAS